MAAKCPDFFEEVDDLLACTICLERCQQPKSLPCLHPFCRDCLQQLINKADGARNINCPSCRTEVPIPAGGAESFPDAFLLKTIGETIDKFKVLRTDGTQNCSPCEKKGKQTRASTLCVECEKTMCAECLLNHNEFVKDHNLMECTDLQSKDLNQLLQMKADKCNKHGNKSTELYCSTCKELICVVCAMLEHNQHEKQSLESVVKGHKGELQTFLDQLLKRDQHYDKCISKADEAETHCTTNMANRIKAVKQQESDVIKAAQAFAKQTISDIKTGGSQTINEIQSVRGSMRQEQAKLSTTLKHVYASMNFANSPSIIKTAARDKQMYRAILQELLPQHSLPNVTIDLKCANVQQMTKESLIGSVTCTRSSEPLAAEMVTVPRRVPTSRPGTLVARKVGQLTVPYKPNGVACTPQGNIVVCEYNTRNAAVYQPDGRELVKLRMPQSSLLFDVACDANKILVTDKDTQSVLEFGSDGSFVRSVKVGFIGYRGIGAFKNKIYVTDNTKVYVVDWPSGHKQVFVENKANAEINNSLFVAGDHSSVAVSCTGNDTLLVFNKDGRLKFTYKGQAPAALSYPRGVVIDADGRVLISSFNNHLIHIVSSEGQFLGKIDISQDGLRCPVGLALNPQGQLVVGAWGTSTVATYDYTFS